MTQIFDHANPPFDAKQKRKLLRWAMNAQVLRIVHRKCNLTKPKSPDVVNAAFEQKYDRKSRL